MPTNSRIRRALLILLAFSALSPAGALAQERTPDYRVDVELPGVGVGHVTQDGAGGVGELRVGARMVGREGHGAFLDTMIAADMAAEWFDERFFAVWLVEAGYVYRARLAGTDIHGLGLDLGPGLVFGTGDMGGAIGGVSASISLDYRAYGFVIGLEGRTRLLLAEGRAELLTTALLRVGFGFWG